MKVSWILICISFSFLFYFFFFFLFLFFIFIWIDMVWKPIVLQNNVQKLLILDSYGVHKASLGEFHSLNTKILIITGGLTSVLQPLDMGIFSQFKALMRNHNLEHYNTISSCNSEKERRAVVIEMRINNFVLMKFVLQTALKKHLGNFLTKWKLNKK